MPARSRRSRPRSSRLGVAALGCAGLLGVSGCNLAPPYVTPPAPTPAAYKEAGPWAPAEPGDAAPRRSWWSAFRDPVLDRLEGEVAASNPSLATALATFDQARAFAAEAQASGVPTLSASGALTTNRQSDQRPLRGAGQPDLYAANTLGGTLGYEFDFWGRVRNSVLAGKALAQAASADLETARLSLQALLADDYFALRGLDAQDELLTSTVDAYQRALTLTQVRHAGGVASGLDVSRAAAQLSSARAAISEVRAQRALYEHAIAVLTGRAPAQFALAVRRGALPAPETPAGVPSALLERRSDVAAAERRAFAANREIGVARAAYFPTLTLDAQGGWQNTGGANLFSLPDTFWTLGPQAALVLFDGGLRRAQNAAARAAFAAASAEYRGVVLQALQQVEDALVLSSRLAQEQADQAAAVQAAQTTTRLSLIRYREGATNYLDVVVAQTAELQAEEALLQLQTRRSQNAVNLIRALGGGWSRSDLPSLRDASRVATAPAAAPAAPAASAPPVAPTSATPGA